jgi:hypothetical protein
MEIPSVVARPHLPARKRKCRVFRQIGSYAPDVSGVAPMTVITYAPLVEPPLGRPIRRRSATDIQVVQLMSLGRPCVAAVLIQVFVTGLDTAVEVLESVIVGRNPLKPSWQTWGRARTV